MKREGGGANSESEEKGHNGGNVAYGIEGSGENLKIK